MWLVYTDIVRFVEKAVEKNPEHIQYKVDLLGPDTIVDAPERYYDIAMVRDLGISLLEWDSPDRYPLRNKAEIRAQSYLKNMVDVVERHYKMQDDAEKKRMSANTNGNT